MKKSLNYLKLWQKKRNELQINDDPQADWLQMRSLLDQHMPATNHSVGKTPKGFKGLKLLPKLFIAFAAAAMVYTASHVFLFKKHPHQTKYKLHKNTSILGDSAFTGSSSAAKESIAYTDSLIMQRQSVTRQSDSYTKPGLAKATAKMPTSDTTVGNPPVASPKKSNSSLLSTGAKISAENNLNAQNKTSQQNKTQMAYNNLHSNKASVGLLAANKTYNSIASSARYGHGNSLIQPGANRRRKSYTSTRTIGRTKIAGQKMTGGSDNQRAIISTDSNSDDNNADVVIPSPHISNIALSNSMKVLAQNSLKIASPSLLPGGKPVKSKTGKNARTKNTNPSNLDWGILMGVNSSGSFTPVKQNSNFYGSAPVDLFFGLFASYKLNNNWAVSSQVRLFSPQTIATTYSHANQSKIDSGQSLKITSSRKQYAISVPIYLQYKATSSISFKAGPVINIPVKQTGANSVLQPAGIRSDSAYYSKITGILNASQYDQTINLGFSGGAGIQFKRWVLEATYLKSLSGYKVTSGLGTYKSNNGTLQLSIGFQLNKPKL